MDVVCLHGFLGQSYDWELLELESNLSAKITYPNLLTDPKTIQPFWNWAQIFNETVPSDSLLMGYSLGGRLAMHAVLDNPQLYKGVVIISSHYGLENTEEKKTRLKKDQAWATKFRNTKWESVIQEWNLQPVFSNDSHVFDRHEKEYSREALARSLEVWSLGTQDCLRHQLEQLTTPVLYVVGEDDTRYSGLAQDLQLRHRDSNIWIARQSGHRVPWQQPKEFIKRVSLFIDRIQGEPNVNRSDAMEPSQTI
jgi:2-succinyl-6-hydroxy-2,4-cyclohexadiene-1-carboxylate synthase